MTKETQTAHLMNYYEKLKDLDAMLVEGWEDDWKAIFEYAGRTITWHFATFGNVPTVDYWVDWYAMMKEREEWMRRES